jgi:hypothetical protein
LKLGRPWRAPWSDAKTYSAGRLRSEGERMGSSFAGYVTSGKCLKRRASGAGMANQSVLAEAGLLATVSEAAGIDSGIG